MYSAKGYVAVMEDNIIISYRSEKERSRICGLRHGKRQRCYEDTDAIDVLEKWLIEGNRVKYKVEDVNTKVIHYYNDLKEAEIKAAELGTDVYETGKGIVDTRKTLDTVKTDINGYNLNKLGVEEETTVNGIDKYIEDNLKSMSEFIDNLKVTKQLLCSEQSLIDKKIIDIQHKIEFTKCDASNGYKLYKLLHDTLNQRRIVKDNILKIDIVLKTNINSNTRKIDRDIDKLYDRSYRPRVMTELFVGN